MKKAMISTTLFSLLATTTLLSAGQIQAAPTDVDGKTTDAAVVFTEKSNPLVITAVPDFHFGSHEIDRSADQDLAAVASGSHIGTANTLTTSNVVSIQDDRSQAKLDGWDLQVAQTDFANAGTTDASDANPSDVLTGVNIFFKTPNVTIDGANKGDAALPTTSNQTVQINDQASTFMKGGATSFGNVVATLGTAPTSGTASDAIFLHVPKTINPTDKAHYQSDITWTLIASPNS